MPSPVSGPSIVKGFKWEGAAAGVQYVIVKQGATQGGCDTATATTDVILGVLQNSPAIGGIAEVMMFGRSLIVANGNSVNIAIGDYLTATTAGAAIKAVIGGTVAADMVVGNAEQATAADGNYIQAMIRPMLTSIT